MSYDGYEGLPTNKMVNLMTAGALAGIFEHFIMFPMDSVKTRMQSLLLHRKATIREVMSDMVKRESGGILRPVFGIQIVLLGDGPAHALYFGTYEFLKAYLIDRLDWNNYASYAVSGMMATLLRDGITTPADAIKQRLQMKDSPYRGVFDCARRVFKVDGLGAFYRAYTTQITMTIPYQAIHFVGYETAQMVTNPERRYSPLAHMVSGAFAGGMAAGVTNPLDVCKTYLNTQAKKGESMGLFGAAKAVYSTDGVFSFLRGIQARVLYQMPSTAICWSTYEFFKWFLTRKTEK